MVVVGRGGLRGLRLVCKAKALRQPENGLGRYRAALHAGCLCCFHAAEAA